MPQRIKRVVRSDLWVDGVFEERLSREPDIAVRRFSVKGPAQAARETLARPDGWITRILRVAATIKGAKFARKLGEPIFRVNPVG